MRSFEFWKFRTSEPAGAKKWSYRLVVFGISMGVLALGAEVATSDWSQREVPAAMTGRANAYSGGGNLVPVF
jgi:hypothetical protein